MKWSFSNIAWTAQQDEMMYRRLRDAGFTMLEIAPTRIIPEEPYWRLAEIRAWSQDLETRFGLRISSMQSIWYGRKENLFADPEQREILLAYTKDAIRFAEAARCPHLVFGCPKNRNLPERSDSSAADGFFRELADYAEAHGAVIGIEANPAIYGTNFINTTAEALALVRRIGSKGLKLNLDIGTMIENGETAAYLKGAADQISHVHISEPYLKPIRARKLHGEILSVLSEEGYQGCVSVEMGDPGDSGTRMDVMQYIGGLMRQYGAS